MGHQYTPLVDYKEHQSLILSGNKFSEKESLLLFCEAQLQEEIPEWECSLYTSILSWIDDKDYVELRTSGSTGEPKVIRADKNRMIRSAIQTGNYFSFQEGLKALLPIPTNFIGGYMMLVRAFVWKLDLTSIEPKAFPKLPLDKDIYFAPFTPVQVENLLKEEDSRKKLESIQYIIIGGATISKKLEEECKSLSNQMFSTYGMTETLSHVALRKLSSKNISSSYQALPNIKISLSSDSCLIVDTNGIAEDILHTNDIAEILSDGSFIIKGRRDNIMNIGGVKISPEEVENKIQSFIPTTDYITFENEGEIALIIERTIEVQKNLHLITSSIKSLKPSYRFPRKIFIIDKLIKTPTEKINRKKTIQKLLEEIKKGIAKSHAVTDEQNKGD